MHKTEKFDVNLAIINELTILKTILYQIFFYFKIALGYVYDWKIPI